MIHSAGELHQYFPFVICQTVVNSYEHQKLVSSNYRRPSVDPEVETRGFVLYEVIAFLKGTYLVQVPTKERNHNDKLIIFVQKVMRSNNLKIPDKTVKRKLLHVNIILKIELRRFFFTVRKANRRLR